MEQEPHEYKLSLALNEAITLFQMAAKEIEGGDEVCLKEQREGLEAINNDIVQCLQILMKHLSKTTTAGCVTTSIKKK